MERKAPEVKGRRGVSQAMYQKGGPGRKKQKEREEDQVRENGTTSSGGADRRWAFLRTGGGRGSRNGERRGGQERSEDGEGAGERWRCEGATGMARSASGAASSGSKARKRVLGDGVPSTLDRGWPGALGLSREQLECRCSLQVAPTGLWASG